MTPEQQEEWSLQVADEIIKRSKTEAIDLHEESDG